ncbi:calcitonin gene-related peptide type 1 receptor-like isoform X2 [Tubulanus polymorphus]|uniref:calcitonin gene-related peptide type 1 receptor-like isoform X2 n=1 Tax=Tubulanus polymorphus TaxID=672921 RepID=UPI003DA4716E
MKPPLFAVAVVLIIVSVLFHPVAVEGTAQNCYLSKFGYFNETDFQTISCSYCFVGVFFNRKNLTINTTMVYSRTQLNLVLKENNSRYLVPDAFKSNSLVCKKYLSDQECEKWRSCCRAAQQCCDRQLKNTPTPTQATPTGGPTHNYCPMAWDGVSCWDHTLGGVTATQNCPLYYVGHGLELLGTFKSTRTCSIWGKWAKKTNYKNCFNAGEMKVILKIAVYVGFGCNITSMVCLVLATFIYIYFRGLRKDESSKFRARLHLSLFGSFFLLHFVLSIWEPVFYLDGLINSSNARINQNTVGCRFLHSFLWFARGATYWCLLCESIYLHQKIHAWSISNVTESIKKYVIIGWGIPLIPVITWIIVKVQLDNENCWMRSHNGNSNLNFIVQLPNILTLLIILILMCNIQRILLTTMRGHGQDRDVMILKRVLRATVAMVPMCGLQMLFLMFRPENWWPYDIIENVLIGTQGMFVSIFYCFVNKEVRNEIRASLRHGRRGSLNSTFNTYSTRLTSTETRNGSVQLRPSEFSRNSYAMPDLHGSNEDYLNAYSTTPNGQNQKLNDNNTTECAT